MRFSIVLTTLSLALSATAAVVNKRAVTSATQTCINDFVAADNNISPAINLANAYSPTADFTLDFQQYLPVYKYQYAVRNNLTNAETSCCSISSTVSDEDANAVLSELGIFVPHLVSLLDVLTTKKPEFDITKIVYAMAGSEIHNTHPVARTVLDCVIAFTPSGLVNNVQQYAATLENAFEAAFTTYNLTLN